MVPPLPPSATKGFGRCSLRLGTLTPRADIVRRPPPTPHPLVPGTLCWRGMDLEARLTELYDDLGEMEGELVDNGALGRVFNGLLGEVRDGHGDDPVVAEIELMGFNFSGHTASSAESLRTVVGQLRTVVRGN